VLLQLYFVTVRFSSSDSKVIQMLLEESGHSSFVRYCFDSRTS